MLPEIAGSSFDVHQVYPNALRRSQRGAAFRDFLAQDAIATKKCKSDLVVL